MADTAESAELIVNASTYGDYSDPSDRDAAESHDTTSAAASTSYDAHKDTAENGSAVTTAVYGSEQPSSDYSATSASAAPAAVSSLSAYSAPASSMSAGPRMPNLAHKMYVGNLPPNATERDVHQFFADSPVPCALPARVDMKSGYAFVHFERNDGLDEAVPRLNGADLMGSKVRVEWSKPAGSRCFICKQDGHWARDCPSSRESYGGGGGGGSSGGYRGGRDRDRSYSGYDRSRGYDRDRSPGRYGGGGGGYRDRSPRRGYSPRRSPPRSDYGHHGGYDYSRAAPYAAPSPYAPYAVPPAAAPYSAPYSAAPAPTGRDAAAPYAPPAASYPAASYPPARY